MNQNAASTTSSLSIDAATRAHLAETAKWARLLAILGMVVLLLGLVVAVMAATVFTTFMGVPTGVDVTGNGNSMGTARVTLLLTSIVMSVIFFFPLLFLLRYANDMKRAVTVGSQKSLNYAADNLKTYFRYLVFLSVLFLLLYGVIIAIGVIGLSAAR